MQLSESPHHIPRFHLAQHKIKPKQTNEELITKMGRKKAMGSGRVEPKRAFERRFGLLLCWGREGQGWWCLGVFPRRLVKNKSGSRSVERSRLWLVCYHSSKSKTYYREKLSLSLSFSHTIHTLISDGAPCRATKSHSSTKNKF